MKNRVEAMLAEVQSLRKEAFQAADEELHTLLGRIMANLIRVKEHLNG
jgi:hypothetical protein